VPTISTRSGRPVVWEGLLCRLNQQGVRRDRSVRVNVARAQRLAQNGQPLGDPVSDALRLLNLRSMAGKCLHLYLGDCLLAVLSVELSGQIRRLLQRRRWSGEPHAELPLDGKDEIHMMIEIQASRRPADV